MLAILVFPENRMCHVVQIVAIQRYMDFIKYRPVLLNKCCSLKHIHVGVLYIQFTGWTTEIVLRIDD